MPANVIAVEDPRALALACEALQGGGLIVYPTDTLYALGGRAHDALAVRRVRHAKGRPDSRPLPVVAGDWDQVLGLARQLPPHLSLLAERFWPGPLTLVLPAAADLPDALTSGTGTVAVRIPGLAFARQLCLHAGPLIATSANVSGAEPATTCVEALSAVGTHVGLAVDAGPAVASAVSTVVDLTGDHPRLLRSGAVAWQPILEALLPRPARDAGGHTW